MKLIDKQRHKKTCSVVAYANLHKLMGRKMSYKKAYKAWKKRGKGTRIIDLVRALEKDFNVIVLKIPYTEVVRIAKLKDYAVAVNYAWGKNSAHVAVMDRKGRSVNARKKPIKPKRWKETKKIWSTGPLTIVVSEKEND